MPNVREINVKIYVSYRAFDETNKPIQDDEFRSQVEALIKANISFKPMAEAISGLITHDGEISVEMEPIENLDSPG